MAIADRKAEHLRIAGAAGVDHQIPTGLDDVRLQHRALPERRLADIRLDADVLGQPLAAPLLISAMTGGTPEAQEVNGALVAAAAAKGIGLVLGRGAGCSRTRAPAHVPAQGLDAAAPAAGQHRCSTGGRRTRLRKRSGSWR